MFDCYNIIVEADLVEAATAPAPANKRARTGKHWHSHHITRLAKFFSCIGSAR